MDKKQLINCVSKKTGLHKVDVKVILETFFTVIREKPTYKVDGLGKFRRRRKGMYYTREMHTYFIPNFKFDEDVVKEVALATSAMNKTISSLEDYDDHLQNSK